MRTQNGYEFGLSSLTFYVKLVYFYYAMIYKKVIFLILLTNWDMIVLLILFLYNIVIDM